MVVVVRVATPILTSQLRSPTPTMHPTSTSSNFLVLQRGDEEALPSHDPRLFFCASSVVGCAAAQMHRRLAHLAASSSHPTACSLCSPPRPPPTILVVWRTRTGLPRALVFSPAAPAVDGRARPSRMEMEVRLRSCDARGGGIATLTRATDRLPRHCLDRGCTRRSTGKLSSQVLTFCLICTFGQPVCWCTAPLSPRHGNVSDPLCQSLTPRKVAMVPARVDDGRRIKVSKGRPYHNIVRSVPISRAEAPSPADGNRSNADGSSHCSSCQLTMR